MDIYNPFSVLNAFDSHDIRDYWFSSGTPTYLIRLMNHFNEGIDKLTGKYYSLDEFVNYKADTEYPLPMIYQSGTPTYLIRLMNHFNEGIDKLTGKYYSLDEFVNYKADTEYPLPMIYQSGYLTIKDYDRDIDMFLLDFPNNEVKSGFLTMVAANYFQNNESADSWTKRTIVALKRGETEKFRTLLTSFLASIPYTARRKENEREKERYFQYTFYLLLRLMSVYTVHLEMEQSEGRVDCVVETPKYVYIFEFKLDGTAAQALRQIQEKGYARPYQALRQIQEKGYARPYLSDSRQVHLIGVNFSSATGTVDGWECADSIL